MSSTGWNCKSKSSDSKDHGIPGYSSDRITCTYTTNSGVSYGGFVSNQSHNQGSTGGEGYGAGVSVGFSFK